MKWTLAALGAIVIVGLVTFGFRERQSDLAFANLADAKTRLMGAGFYCTPDSADGSLAAGFLLSRIPTTWNEAGALRKIGPMGPAWQGKAWVTFSTPIWQLHTLPEGAGLRSWGKVLAFGDETLLREIDGRLP